MSIEEIKARIDRLEAHLGIKPEEPEIDWERVAVNCQYWSWLPGMRIYDVSTNVKMRITETNHNPPYPDWLPMLDDPATLGCLMYLVGESWDGSPPDITDTGDHYAVEVHCTESAFTGKTLGEALVRALARDRR